MHVIYIDDSGQKESRRRHMGELVSVGGVIVPEHAVAGFAAAFEGIRADLEIPADEEIKWKPPRNTFQAAASGELIDISDASRPIKDEEKAACQAKGITYEEFQVANDALTVVVPKENTWATCLTVDQLKKIWEPDSKVTSWNQVDPKFPNEPLKLFGPGTDSGTFDYFTDVINGEEGKSRTDYQPSEDDNVIVQGVAGSKGGLGYFGFSYFEANSDKLNAVQVDGGGGCVAPSVQAAQDGSYKPLSRPLFIYPAASALKRPEVLAFVEFYVANHAEIAKQAKFVPLNATQEAELKSDLDKLKQQAGQ